jgi:hypothetical protein
MVIVTKENVMNELIYKQDAIDAMCLACGYDCDKSEFVYNAPQDEQVIMCPEHYALSTLPSAEPRKKGKWIPLQLSIANPPYQCSCCSKNAPMVETGSLVNRYLEALLTDFCPNCGADMRGEEE